MEVISRACFYPPFIGVATEMVSSLDGIRQELSRRIINTEDQLIREQLIKLGWIPPAPKDVPA